MNYKKLAINTFKSLGLSIVLFVVFFGAINLILPKIKMNIDGLNEVSKEHSIQIYLANNGTHTDFIVPYSTELYKWSEYFDSSHTSRPELDVKYLKIGWGDSKIYFETPTWDDLTLGNAWRAMIGANESVLRVDYLINVEESDNCIGFRVSMDQYKHLITYITNSLYNNEPIENLVIESTYGKTCAFYKGNGRLSMFNVCNTWVNRGLYESGLPSVYWTLSHEPIFDLYRSNTL